MTVQQLQAAVASLFPAAKYPGSYTMSVDTSGNATIALWDNTLGAEPTTAQLSAALTAMQLAAAQQTQISTVTSAYEAARFGATVSITSGSNTMTFPTDPTTQTNISGLLQGYIADAARNGSNPKLPTTMPLEDSSKTVQSLTQAQLQDLAVLIVQESVTAFNKYKSLVAQINAATTIPAVQAIVWS